MTDSYLTLTEFVPGTKAKAQEVNANFSTLKEALNKKAAMAGDGTQAFAVADAVQDVHAINKGQFDDLSADLSAEIKKAGMKFCVKSGNTTNGEGDLFSYSLLKITPKIGGAYSNLVIADYKGTQTTISSAVEISMSGKPNGDYNIFIKPDGTLYTLANIIYKQHVRPTMNDGDIWFDTSKVPFNCIKYDGMNENAFLDVPLAKVTIANGATTAIKTFPFNQNGYDINAYTVSAKKFNYANPVNKDAGIDYTAESNGLLFIKHANTNDTITVKIDGYLITLGWSSSQGSSSSDFIPVAKGQNYCFTGGEIRFFVPEIDA